MNFTYNNHLKYSIGGREFGHRENVFEDFKVFDNDGFEYIETKGRTNDNDELKWAAVRDKGLRLKVLFNNDIKLLEKQYNM
jgi:hypothetical protein